MDLSGLIEVNILLYIDLISDIELIKLLIHVKSFCLIIHLKNKRCFLHMPSVAGAVYPVQRTPLLNNMDLETWSYKTDC
jgi:hypothetical protein